MNAIFKKDYKKIEFLAEEGEINSIIATIFHKISQNSPERAFNLALKLFKCGGFSLSFFSNEKCSYFPKISGIVLIFAILDFFKEKREYLIKSINEENELILGKFFKDYLASFYCENEKKSVSIGNITQILKKKMNVFQSSKILFEEFSRVYEEILKNYEEKCDDKYEEQNSIIIKENCKDGQLIFDFDES